MRTLELMYSGVNFLLLQVLFYTLALLMIIAWVIFSTCGIAMARYMRKTAVFKIFDKQAWFVVCNKYSAIFFQPLDYKS